MRFVNSPSPELSGREPPRDEVDGAFADYFRAEMPNPWPALPTVKPTAAPRLPAQPANSTWGSRFALAASIAVIVLGAWLLSGSFKDVGPTGKSAPRVDNGGANRGHGLPKEEFIQPPMGPTKFRIEFPPERQPGRVLDQINRDLP